MDLVREAHEEDGKGLEVRPRDGEKLRGVSVTKYSLFWYGKFHFASGLKLDSEVTCINVLPFRDYGGLS